MSVGDGVMEEVVVGFLSRTIPLLLAKVGTRDDGGRRRSLGFGWPLNLCAKVETKWRTSKQKIKQNRAKHSEESGSGCV